MTRDLNGKIRIVLIDDHRLFREGLRGILSAEDDLDVVVEGGTGAEAVGLAAQYQPDILLLDVQMSRMSPVMTIRQVIKASPSTRVVVLSMHSDNDLILSLVAAGAAAYLSQDIGGRELCSELRSAAADSRMFAARFARDIIPNGENVTRSATVLTNREIEILRLVSMAMSNSQIAIRLYVSEATVKRHLTNIFTKLKARSRLDAVNRAIALGMLEGPESRSLLS
jgi:DNA-binding NarL/FixJ family response regulator